MSQKQLIYGAHPVRELLQSGTLVQRLWVVPSDRLSDLLNLANRQGVRVEQTSRRVLDELLPGANHQGVAAEVDAFAYTAFEDLAAGDNSQEVLLALDQIQDPHNLGSIIRSSYALGAHGLFFPKDRSCEVTPTVVKTAAGATAHLPIARVTNVTRSLEKLKKDGFWVVGTAPEGDKNLSELDLTGPIVLVIGAEGEGMRRQVAATCDFLARIPMPGHLGSLNASVAAGICLYELARQRTKL